MASSRRPGVLACYSVPASSTEGNKFQPFSSSARLGTAGPSGDQTPELEDLAVMPSMAMLVLYTPSRFL